MQAVAALIVVDARIQRCRKQPRSKGVGPGAWKGHLVKVAPPDDEITGIILVGCKELENISRVVLPIGIKRENGFVALSQRPGKARHQRDSLALVLGMAQNFGSVGLGHGRRLIAGVIVYYQYRQIGSCRLHDGTDAGSLVPGRNEGENGDI